ncbi:phosphatase PAP2 family protein [Natronosalvus vescus]|uniref:phosphatase PAP2 family protein n=1 Tax=Natronosalvus vescus TaxID=2953881 RepID=UPI002090AFAA|nr:phosphatase PAP2 family protein [Natronosalvus vescus]
MWFESAHVEATRDAFPEWMAFLWAFFSSLGSVWFVAPAVVLAFWFANRHRFLPWVATVIGGYALVVGAKGYVGLGRPGVGPAISPEVLPTALAVVYAPLVEVSSSSFPSGHAMAGTIIWCMLALETNVWSRRVRLIGAAAVVALIGFSRIALGLHYPVDVVVGIALALGYLGAILATRRWAADHSTVDPTSATFATVTLIAALSWTIGGQPDAAALLGGAVGLWLVWLVAPPPRDPWPVSPRQIGQTTFGIGGLGVVALLLLAFDGHAVWLLVGLLGGTVVGLLPRLNAGNGRLEESVAG